MACSNSTEANDSHNNDSDNWRIAIYQQYLTDIRWAKERMVRVVQWGVPLLAAMLALSKSITDIPGWLYGVLSILVAAVAIWWLVELHCFGCHTRKRVDELLETMNPQCRYPSDRKFDPNHVKYLVIYIIVVVVAAIFVIIGISL